MFFCDTNILAFSFQLAWVSDVKQALNSDEPARDVATAENLLKKHQDLGDDIAAHQDE